MSASIVDDSTISWWYVPGWPAGRSGGLVLVYAVGVVQMIVQGAELHAGFVQQQAIARRILLGETILAADSGLGTLPVDFRVHLGGYRPDDLAGVCLGLGERVHVVHGVGGDR